MSAAGGYFEISPTDRSMAMLDLVSRVSFHVVCDLAGPLEIELLGRCWDRLGRLHPILTCRADLKVDTRWQPTVGIGEVKLVHGQQVEDLTAVEVGRSLDPVEGPLVFLTAISGDSSFRLVLGAHHAAFDGLAGVQLVDDLRRLYREETNADPSPDWTPRTVRSALRAHPMRGADRFTVAASSFDRWGRLPASQHARPEWIDGAGSGYVTIDLGPALAALEERRRQRGWPMEAVLVGLLERAWTERFGEGEGPVSGWLVAYDLRPSLGLNRGMGNLSGTEPVLLHVPASLEETIDQASARIAAWKSRRPGLGPELAAAAWSWLPPALLNQGAEAMLRAGRDRGYTRTLSNLGRLPERLADWGETRMEAITIVCPMWEPPYTPFVTYAYRGTSYLTARLSPNGLSPDHLDGLRLSLLRG
ncbi:MAG TPA: hypothetical protein VJR05_01030 [Acidimicrobiia bacterium]|nr:hypothetical protein [Acidimicrobiia bacterium]